jgi:hypothetical protein
MKNYRRLAHVIYFVHVRFMALLTEQGSLIDVVLE